MISTRGRYALKVMIDIAGHDSDSYVPMTDVAARQGLSHKYIEQIIPALKKAGLVEGVHGKGGGYKLCKPASEIPVGEILRLTERELAPVSCLSENATECMRAGECKTIKFWKGLNDTVNNYIDNVMLSELL